MVNISTLKRRRLTHADCADAAAETHVQFAPVAGLSMARHPTTKERARALDV